MSSQQEHRQDRSGTAKSPVLDLWLRRELGRRHDTVLDEALPTELLSLLGEPPDQKSP